MRWTLNNNARLPLMMWHIYFLLLGVTIVDWHQSFTMMSLSWLLCSQVVQIQNITTMFKLTASGFRVNFQWGTIHSWNTDTVYKILCYNEIPFIFSVRTLLHALNLTSHLLMSNVFLSHRLTLKFTCMRLLVS